MKHPQTQHIGAIILFVSGEFRTGLKLGHQSGGSFFTFHDHFVALWVHYFLHDPAVFLICFFYEEVLQLCSSKYLSVKLKFVMISCAGGWGSRISPVCVSVSAITAEQFDIQTQTFPHSYSGQTGRNE